MKTTRQAAAIITTALISTSCAFGQGWTRGKDLSWAPTASTTNVALRYHAIVIGINDYTTPPPIGWEKLTTARGDAEAVADVLEKQYKYEVTRLFDGQATRSAILQALDRLTTYTVDDAVLIYYAGHGMFDEKLGEGFWIPVDGKKKTGQRMPKEDWIWNSTLTKIIGASEARHVLVVADSCYGGSLFRGDALSSIPVDLTWYKRAMTKPSRYLITSGDLEPVLDSGGKHSIFAQTLLNFLQYADKPVFSASELGLSLREKVGTLTGQMVRMGPLSVASHAGGEFVFLGEKADLAELGAAPAAASGPTRGAGEEPSPEPAAPAASAQMLKDAALLDSQGFTNSARTVLDTVLAGQPDNRLAKSLASYFDRERREKSRSELRSLIERIEQKKAAGQLGSETNDAYARPRILACIGPDAAAGGTESEETALLYRISLRSSLEQKGGVILVERDALESVLQEMNLGTSELADPRARTEIGKLLPASVLLMGDLIRGAQSDSLFVRLVDTETTRVLGSVSARAGQDDDVLQVCDTLAGQVVEKLVRAKPLTARVLRAEEGLLVAGIGTFQAVREDQVFDLVQTTEAAAGRKVGTARVVSAGESESRLEVEWLEGCEDVPVESLSVRESSAASGIGG